MTQGFRRSARLRRPVLLVVLGVGLLATLVVGVRPESGAGADTDTLTGKGGSFLSPVVNLLLNDDTGLGLNPQYNDSSIDQGIADFVGSGPDSFNADYAVSERPLTSAESSQAAADGRSFAYVPFAATPVAIATLVLCSPLDLSSGVIDDATFCHNLPLTPALIGDIFTTNLTSTSVQPNANLSARLTGWNDPRFTSIPGDPVSIPDSAGIGQSSILGPAAESSALMALMDSDPTAKEDLDNALAGQAGSASQSTDTPSEVWPFQGTKAYAGGDAGMIGKELSIGAETNAPSALSSWGGLLDVHDAFAVSNVWTGAPLGTPWNIPTAAVENAAQKFVAPSKASAAAAEADATLDPSTNIVTFKPEATDSAAYNNYLMVESYLVVPLTTLPADRAIALAQFIRYVLGAAGQNNIGVLGAAPATPAMVTAGLKVAAELDAEADGPTTTVPTTSVPASSATPSSTTPTSLTPTTIAAAPNSTKKTAIKAATKTKIPSASPVHPAVAASSATSGGGDPQLAFTGFNPTSIVLTAFALVALSETARRRIRRRLLPTSGPKEDE